MQAKAIEQDSHEQQDCITALLSEHLPEEVRNAVQLHIDAMIGNAYAWDDQVDRQLYRVLITLMPGHVKQIKAAFSATVLDGSEDDWQAWEH